MNDEEEFFAWLDGELDEAAADRVAARVAANPELTKLAEQHRAMTASMRGAFAPVADTAGPAPRFALAEVVDLVSRRTERARPSFSFPPWAAMAATLVLGVVAGTMVRPDANGPVLNRGGKLYAAASLDRALDRQLATSQDNEAVRVGLTFRDRQGRICRSFSGVGGQGLACRDGEDWAVEGLFAPASSGGDYRMAAGDNPRVAAMIDEKIAGDPFDAAAEELAQKQGWH